jgi:hypothetical protein
MFLKYKKYKNEAFIIINNFYYEFSTHFSRRLNNHSNLEANKAFLYENSKRMEF